MKAFFYFSFLILALASSLYCQSGSINNTLAAGGTFNIKDGTTTFLTLQQSNGYLGIGTTPNQQLEITKNFRMPNTTTASNVGIMYKAGARFLHNCGTDNTFLGAYTGNLSLTGTKNTGIGSNSLSSITSGGYNSAIGYSALCYNDAGGNNTAVGAFALLYNTDGEGNTAIGRNSLGNNAGGDFNTAVGNTSLYSNTAGIWNTAVGYGALYTNVVGSYNTAVGYNSLYNSTGSQNVGLGNYAGDDMTTGSDNICIGYNSQVPTATASHQVRIGSNTITSASIQVEWSITSDRRWKKEIETSNLGLGFISKLNPVSYIRKNDDRQRVEYGFIAQDIEEVLKQSGINSTGMITIDDKGYYELRYNDLLAPIVKAIQELKAENDSLKKINNNLTNELTSLRTSISSLVKEEVKLVLLKAVQPDASEENVSLSNAAR